MPVERFGAEIPAFKVKDSLVGACEDQGINILNVNGGEDEQTEEGYCVYTVGEKEEDATSFVLITCDASENNYRANKPTHERHHTLIAPKEIIDAVKSRLGESA